MLYYLAYWSETPLRLFRYSTFRAGGAWLTAFLLVVMLGGFTARMLRRFNVRAAERLEGLVPPEFIDKRKSGTPCMGGLLLIGAVAVATLLWARPGRVAAVLVGATVLLSLTGFIDDYIKVTKQDRGGSPAGGSSSFNSRSLASRCGCCHATFRPAANSAISTSRSSRSR